MYSLSDNCIGVNIPYWRFKPDLIPKDMLQWLIIASIKGRSRRGIYAQSLQELNMLSTEHRSTLAYYSNFIVIFKCQLGKKV